MVEWNDERIQFFKDASEYTGFHQKLSEYIKPYLHPEWTVFDIGCGLGLLDIKLADSVKHIKAIDRNEIVIKDYGERVANSQINNISVEVGDANEIKDEQRDVVLLSFYGNGVDEMDRLLSLAKKRVIMITFADELPKDNDASEGRKRAVTSAKEEYLKEKGYSYDKMLNLMEFGQPLKTMEDAYKFFDGYTRIEDPVKRKKVIEEKLNDVIRTSDDSEFPYFYSKQKNIGILIVDI